MTTNDKYSADGSFNLKISRHNIMDTLIYSYISEFSGNLKGMFDEGVYKHPYKIRTRLVGRPNT